MTQYLPLQGIHELKLSENRVKMEIFQPERESYRAGKNCMSGFMIYTLHKILLRL
jgi:hypothetical protein